MNTKNDSVKVSLLLRENGQRIELIMKRQDAEEGLDSWKNFDGSQVVTFSGHINDVDYNQYLCCVKRDEIIGIDIMNSNTLDSQ